MRVKISKNIDKLIFNKKCYAYIIRKFNFRNKYNFITNYNEPLQLGTFNMNNGDNTKKHYHMLNRRIIKKTSEFLYVISGYMTIKFYSKKNKLLNYSKIKKGGSVLIFDNAHELFYGPNTKILEIKMGPYSKNEKKFL